MARPAFSLAALVALLVAPRALDLYAAASALRASDFAEASSDRSARQASQESGGLILGRVIDASNGQPMASAVVRLSAGASVQYAAPPGKSEGLPDAPQAVLTGADGRFVFAPIPSGSFTLTAERSGYFDSAYGTRRPLGDGRTVVLSAGERVGDLTIQMWPWASISGTVVNEIGGRVAGVTIQAIRQGLTGAATTGDVMTAITDVHGQYRIQPLAPGKYIVAAAPRAMNIALPGDAQLPPAGLIPPPPGSGAPSVMVDAIHRSLLAITGPVRQSGDPREKDHPFVYVTSFYGGATSRWQAKPLDVVLGQQISNIDLAVALHTSVRVAGSVIGPRGPVAQALVRLLSSESDNTDSQDAEIVSAITGDDGKFVFPPVAAGNYVLDAVRLQPAPSFSLQSSGAPKFTMPSPSSRDREGYWARASVLVTDRDIPDLLVTMRAGSKIRGDIVFQRPAAAEAGPFRLVLRSPSGADITSGSIRSDVAGSFQIAGIPAGSYVLEAQGLADGWEISSAVLNGRDITGTPFDVGSSDLSGLVVTLGNRAIEIRGDVLDAQGKLVQDATVLLISADTTSWKNVSKASRNVQAMRATNGGYTFRGLAAGSYYVTAMDDAQMDDFPAPEMLRRLISGLERIEVTPSERRVVNVTVRGRR